MCNCVWYNFLHLSIHEFLAACYLKSLDPSEKFQILKQTFFIKRYTNVWNMFIGLQEKVTYKFHQLLTHNHIYETSSKAAKSQMILIMQKLHLLNFSEINKWYLSILLL